MVRTNRGIYVTDNKEKGMTTQKPHSSEHAQYKQRIWMSVKL